LGAVAGEKALTWVAKILGAVTLSNTRSDLIARNLFRHSSRREAHELLLRLRCRATAANQCHWNNYRILEVALAAPPRDGHRSSHRGVHPSLYSVDRFVRRRRAANWSVGGRNLVRKRNAATIPLP